MNFRFLLCRSFYIIVLLSFVVSVYGQDFTLRANPNAPQELNQLNYLIGEWVLVSFSRETGGEFSKNSYTTDFRAYYLSDGYSIQSESYDKENRDNFVGINIYLFDPDSDLFRITYFNAKRSRIIAFKGEKTGDKQFTISNFGSYAQKEFHYKEVDTIVSDDLFIKRLYKSTDQGRTWQEMNYYYEYQRRK